MFDTRKKPVTVAVTAKGFAYFTRKHIEQQVDNLRLFQEYPKDRKLFDSDCVTDCVMAARRKKLVPVVSFLPFDDARDVFSGRASLVKSDVRSDDARDNAKDNA